MIIIVSVLYFIYFLERILMFESDAIALNKIFQMISYFEQAQRLTGSVEIFFYGWRQQQRISWNCKMLLLHPDNQNVGKKETWNIFVGRFAYEKKKIVIGYRCFHLIIIYMKSMAIVTIEIAYKELHKHPIN